jgi:hypothetical protein
MKSKQKDNQLFKEHKTQFITLEQFKEMAK